MRGDAHGLVDCEKKIQFAGLALSHAVLSYVCGKGRPPPAAGRIARRPVGTGTPVRECLLQKRLELGQHDLRSLLHRPLEGEARSRGMSSPAELDGDTGNVDGALRA